VKGGPGSVAQKGEKRAPDTQGKSEIQGVSAGGNARVEVNGARPLDIRKKGRGDTYRKG
jgi:hypothetical protein